MGQSLAKVRRSACALGRIHIIGLPSNPSRASHVLFQSLKGILAGALGKGKARLTRNDGLTNVQLLSKYSIQFSAFNAGLSCCITIP